MNYIEAMEYIHKIGNFGSNYGLERVEKLLELLGNPHKSLKIIHIAGTNGKGSTTSMITSLLMAEGYSVGMYTSPFLEVFEERVQINRKNISKEDLSNYVEKVKEKVQEVIEGGFGSPTEFEIITCLMFKYFYDKKVDYVALEVGLGGRLDATNVVVPLVSVIASISLDHMNILGNTIEEIAGEKCGIIKEGVPVVVYPQKEEGMSVIEKIAKEKKSEIIYVNENDGELLDIEYTEDKIYQRVKIKGIDKTYEVLMGLLGEHQILNGALALKAVEIGLKRDGKSLGNLEDGFKNTVWAGRLEVLDRKPLVVIDGAHNIDGIKMLKKNIRRYFKFKKLYLIIGILADKQVKEMLDVILEDVEEVVALTPNSGRAELADELKEEIKEYNVKVESYEDYEEGFKEIYKKAGEDDLILATGSLYMIGEMRGIIKRNIK
ncbi:folylpolyglutamate synthase/dihydrofolate synthase family protein [uncultured Clostridium sp.]|uniref:bifunctional folylpolyglutamate synthase/dihydrofolate synthase n=1 Tax=uncultured Clostridium sp. TaxID=59620 RepID=UPI002625321A|nr:folylpolyglutamate synthase/dihydrofolate synthase family protein [uncultured Clostridium sp.]